MFRTLYEKAGGATSTIRPTGLLRNFGDTTPVSALFRASVVSLSFISHWAHHIPDSTWSERTISSVSYCLAFSYTIHLTTPFISPHEYTQAPPTLALIGSPSFPSMHEPEPLCLLYHHTFSHAAYSSWTAWSLKMKAVCSSKFWEPLMEMTQHHIPEDLNPQRHPYFITAGLIYECHICP
jgi:hypothetical protein